MFIMYNCIYEMRKRFYFFSNYSLPWRNVKMFREIIDCIIFFRPESIDENVILKML